MKLTKLRYICTELKFVRSPRDLRIFYDKFPIWIRKVIKDQKDTEVPLTIQLEPTNCCNLRCTMCPQDVLKRDRGYMDLGLFHKIIDDAAKIGVKRIWLFMQGESLLHPDIVKMVGYIKKKRLGIDLTTNGMLLDAQKAKALFESGMDSADYLTFSIMGYSKEVHETVMKGANHERVVQNLLGLMELRRHCRISGPIVQTDFYAMPENQHEATAYEEYWRGKVDRVLPARPVSRLFSRHGDMSQITQRHEICTQAWERMTVYWNGDVTICNQDVHGEYVFGNLQDQSIKELWNCETFRQFKRLHKETKFEDLPLCNHCDALPITYWVRH